MAGAALRSCKNPEDVPLFSNDMCVSPMTYAVLLLTTIAVAGAAFIILLVFFVCIRCFAATHSNKQYRAHNNVTDVSTDDDDDTNTIGHLPGANREKQISNVLKKVLDDASRQPPTATYDNHNFIIPPPHTSPVTPLPQLVPLPDLPSGRRSRRRRRQYTKKPSNAYELSTNPSHRY